MEGGVAPCCHWDTKKKYIYIIQKDCGGEGVGASLKYAPAPSFLLYNPIFYYKYH